MFSCSPETSKVFAALKKAQSEFPVLKKDAKNPHFGSRYATLDAAIEALQPTLTANGLAVSQPAAGDGVGTGCTTILFHDSGEWFAETLLLPSNSPGKDTHPNAQSATAAVTYSRRTGYLSILGVVADEDDDGNRAVGRTTTTKVDKKVAPAATSAKISPPKASIPNGTKADVIASTVTPSKKPADVKNGNEVEHTVATEEELKRFRKKYQALITTLGNNGLTEGKGNPYAKKVLKFLLSFTKAENAEHISKQTWEDFFARVDAKLATPEGIKHLVQLVENAAK